MTPAHEGADGADDPGIIVRSEEELVIGTVPVEAGAVRARKVVDEERVRRLVPVDFEEAEVERSPAPDGDSGEVETLRDGSISIPVFEERLVVRKVLAVRERIVIRKHTVTGHRTVEADLRRERVEVEVDPEVANRVVDER